MPVTIKKIALWRTEVENKPGALSGVLAPLADAGADLQVVMGYRYPGDKRKAMIEVGPLAGKKSAAAASKAGLTASGIPALLVQGDNRPGLGHTIARAIAEARINVTFVVAQVVDARFSAAIGFASEAASAQATRLIKSAVKELDKQFPPSAEHEHMVPGAERNGAPLLGRTRAPILCRKKCDVLLGSICSDG